MSNNLLKFKEKIVVNTDGGSRGNPGPSAIAAIIKDRTGHTLKTCQEVIGLATNNEAEYRAVILALEKIKALWGKEGVKKLAVEVNLDSELIVNQLNGKYKIEEEKLFQFFVKIWNLKMDFPLVLFKYVSREKNKDADGLVNEALDKDQKSLFSPSA